MLGPQCPGADEKPQKVWVGSPPPVMQAALLWPPQYSHWAGLVIGAAQTVVSLKKKKVGGNNPEAKSNEVLMECHLNQGVGRLPVAG